jgi:hypothetical protein
MSQQNPVSVRDIIFHDESNLRYHGSGTDDQIIPLQIDFAWMECLKS